MTSGGQMGLLGLTGHSLAGGSWELLCVESVHTIVLATSATRYNASCDTRIIYSLGRIKTLSISLFAAENNCCSCNVVDDIR